MCSSLCSLHSATLMSIRELLGVCNIVRWKRTTRRSLPYKEDTSYV